MSLLVYQEQNKYFYADYTFKSLRMPDKLVVVMNYMPGDWVQSGPVFYRHFCCVIWYPFRTNFKFRFLSCIRLTFFCIFQNSILYASIFQIRRERCYKIVKFVNLSSIFDFQCNALQLDHFCRRVFYFRQFALTLSNKNTEIGLFGNFSLLCNRNCFVTS